jgi:hypothetical protein
LVTSASARLLLQAVWFLKCRALTAKSYIDDTDMEEAGVAEMLLDDNAMASAPRCVAPATMRSAPLCHRRRRIVPPHASSLACMPRPSLWTSRVGFAAAAFEFWAAAHTALTCVHRNALLATTSLSHRAVAVWLWLWLWLGPWLWLFVTVTASGCVSGCC